MRYHNGYVIRPMLDTNRKEIERYLAGKGQALRHGQHEPGNGSRP